MKTVLSRIWVLAAVGFIIVSMVLGGSGCKLLEQSTGPKAKCDDCAKNELDVHLQKIMHDTETFYLESPNACNGCEARYYFFSEWANPQRRLTDTSQPPLLDMTHLFSPAAEYAYFGHPPPSYQPSDHFWLIDFRVGNKNSSAPSTKYSVYAAIDKKRPHSAADSILIDCTIKYVPVE